MIVAMSLGGGMTVAPFCLLNATDLQFHVAITTRWTEDDGGTASDERAYQVRCKIKDRECVGASVRLDRDRLGLFDLQAMSGIELRSSVGGVAVLSWGVHQFVMDDAAGTVTMTSASRRGVSERGVGRCK